MANKSTFDIHYKNLIFDQKLFLMEQMNWCNCNTWTLSIMKCVLSLFPSSSALRKRRSFVYFTGLWHATVRRLLIHLLNCRRYWINSAKRKQWSYQQVGNLELRSWSDHVWKVYDYWCYQANKRGQLVGRRRINILGTKLCEALAFQNGNACLREVWSLKCTSKNVLRNDWTVREGQLQKSFSSIGRSSRTWILWSKIFVEDKNCKTSGDNICFCAPYSRMQTNWNPLAIQRNMSQFYKLRTTYIILRLIHLNLNNLFLKLSI